MKFRLGYIRVNACVDPYIYIYIPNAKLYLIKNAVKIKRTEMWKGNKSHQLHHFRLQRFTSI